MSKKKTFRFYANDDFRFSRSFYFKQNLHTNLVHRYGKQIDANHCHQIRADPRHQCIISQAVVHHQPFMYRHRYNYSIYNKYKRATQEENVTHVFCLKTTKLHFHFRPFLDFSNTSPTSFTTAPFPLTPSPPHSSISSAIHYILRV